MIRSRLQWLFIGATLTTCSLSFSIAAAQDIVVDGRLVRYESIQSGSTEAVAFQMESKGYQNTYVLDCANRHFRWAKNVDLRTGEETGNNAQAEWKALNPGSTVANAVYQKACPGQGQATAASESSGREQLPLRQGMRYSKAREIILDAGWQARRKPPQDVPDFGVVKDLYDDNGWQEIEDCAGSGTMPCRFEFLDMHNRLLVVITEGECLEGSESGSCDLSLSRWFIDQSGASVITNARVSVNAAGLAWKANHGVALINLPDQQSRVGVIFPVEHQCQAAVFYVAGKPGLTSVSMTIDQQPVGTMQLGEFTLEDGTPISGAGLSQNGVQALSQGSQLWLESEQGNLEVPLSGSADAFRQALSFCQSELAANAPQNPGSRGGVRCDGGDPMPLTVANHERFMQKVLQIAGKNGMGGVNNPGLEVRNFREAMQAMGYSFTATIQAYCATSPMELMTNTAAFAVGADMIRAYDRLSETERRTVYCPEEISAIEGYKNGPNSWFMTGQFPGGRR